MTFGCNLLRTKYNLRQIRDIHYIDMIVQKYSTLGCILILLSTTFAYVQLSVMGGDMNA